MAVGQLTWGKKGIKEKKIFPLRKEASCHTAGNRRSGTAEKSCHSLAKKKPLLQKEDARRDLMMGKGSCNE